MKRIIILFSTFILMSIVIGFILYRYLNVKVELEDQAFFDSFVYANKLENVLLDNEILVLGRNIYNARLRLTVSDNIKVDSTFENIFLVVNSKEIPIQEVLSSMYIIVEQKNRDEQLKIACKKNISIVGKYLYISLSHFPLGIGKYYITDLNADERLFDFGPYMLIGIGKTGGL